MKLTPKISNLLEKHPKLKLLIQFIKFGIVGVSNTLLSLAVTYATMAVFKFGFSIDTTWSLNVCTTLGYIAGVCNSYFWNKRYVFKNAKEQNGKKAFLKTFICYGATYLLSMVLMDVCVIYLSIPNWIAPIPRLIITIPLNFIANKLWAFKDKEEQK
jgi:putative flippase GtrA